MVRQPGRDNPGKAAIAGLRLLQQMTKLVLELSLEGETDAQLG